MPKRRGHMPAQNKKTLGVIAWPTHIQYEGAEAVLDNLMEAGVNTVSTAPMVVRPTDDPAEGRREPPDDGGEGMVREVDRPIWGKHSLQLKTSPSFVSNGSLYRGLKYAAPKADDLTADQGKVIGKFLKKAKSRGLETYLQVQICHIPSIDSENSDTPDETDDLPVLPNGEFPRKRMMHFSTIASDDIQDYFCAFAKDVLEAYPDADGLLLDRAEQSFYTVGDAFVDFGPGAKKKAGELGFDFEAMRGAADRLYRRLESISNDDLRRLQTPADLAYEMATLFRSEPALAEVLRFRTAVSDGYLRKIRAAVTTVSPDKKLLPAVFPPPMSLITGVDFEKYADSVDAVLIKFFTMHWPLIVTNWSKELKGLNPDLDEGLLVRALSTIFGMEESGFGSTIADYAYPAPDQPHRAGSEQIVRKIETAIADAKGKTPVIPSAHGYGPFDDAKRRLTRVWETSTSGMWINRYGYLSDEKLEMLKSLVKGG